MATGGATVHDGVGGKLDALIALTSETSSVRRVELLREVTDVFFAPAPPPPEVLDLFDGALDRLTDALEVELRAELAVRLSSLGQAPRRLVSRLIGDPDGAVAGPLLERSPAVGEADLLHVVSRAGQSHLRAVSRRRDLTERVSDGIVERGDDETLGVLVANPAAPLSRNAAEAVVDRAMANPSLHDAVVGRETLPPDLLNEMYLVVEQRLRDRIAARHAALDPRTLDAALGASRRRMAVRDGALPPDHDAAVAHVAKLAAAGPIPPQTLVGFLRNGERTRFTAAVALAADMDLSSVQRILDRSDAEAFLLICKVARYDEALFRSLLLALKLHGESPLPTLMERYGALTTETADRVVRFWKVRRAGALAA